MNLVLLTLFNFTDPGLFIKLLRSTNMKKLVSTLAIAAVLLTTASFTGCKEKKTASVESGVSKKLAACRKKGKIVFGSSGDEYSYINQKTGKPEGIDTDILAEAMKRLGVPEVEMKLIPFSELIINFKFKYFMLI